MDRPRSRLSRRAGMGVALVVLVSATTAACSSGLTSSSPTTTPPANENSSSGDTTTTQGSFGKGAAIQEDPGHRLVVVNLVHAANGTDAGPAFDLVQVPQETVGLDAKVTGLAFGEASPPIHPGRKASNFDTGDYGLTLVKSGSSRKTTDEIVLPRPTSDWTLEVLVVGGAVTNPGITEFPADPSGFGPNQVPTAIDAKVVLLASNMLGTTNGTGTYDSVLIGPAGGCLPSIAPPYAGDAADEVRTASTFAVPAGTANVGFWTSTKNQWTPADCAGPPIATADLSGLGAKDRAVVLLYGPDATKATTKVVKVPQ